MKDMKDSDIIERLHKAYDVKAPDVLSKLSYSNVEIVPPPKKNLKVRYISAVAVYAAACLVVAIALPFIIGGRGDAPQPKPQPGVSVTNTEQISSDLRDTEETDRSPETETAAQTERDPEITVSIDVHKIPVNSSETTPKNPDPTETTTTSQKPEPEPDIPASKVYGDPADHVRVRFFKDIHLTDEYKSIADIPYGTKVYYEMVSDPGYIFTNFKINVYDRDFDVDLIPNGGCGIPADYFWNNYHGDKLEYSYTAVLAGDADRNLYYDENDVKVLEKYLANDAETRYYYGKYGYSEELDYDCNGVINKNDLAGLIAEIENGDVERTAMNPGKYSGSNVCDKTRLLKLNNAVVHPHGRDYKYVEYDYNMYTYYSNLTKFSKEIRDTYDDYFFTFHDLIMVYCYTENGEIPTVDDLYEVWVTGTSSEAHLDIVYAEDNTGKTLSEYVICIPVSHNKNIVDKAPT